MFGSLGDLPGILKTAKQLQTNLAKLQSEIANRRFNGESGGGLVKATVDGRGALVDIHIEPQATGDVSLLEDLVRGAVNVAAAKAHEATKADMSAMTGGLPLPGLDAFLGQGG